MNKLKRYVGLAMAVALLALAFVPLENDSHPMASKVTPLDGTVLTKLTGVGGRDMALWIYATGYMNRCFPFQETSMRVASRFSLLTCNGDGYLFSTLAHDFEAELLKFEPALSTLLREYLDIPILTKVAPASGLPFFPNVASTTNYSSYLNGVDGPKRNPRSLQIELQIGTAMAKYLQSVRVSIAIGIYLVHVLAILFFVGLVLARESVGALLLWPFTLIFGAAKVGTKVAKSLHDKV